MHYFKIKVVGIFGFIFISSAAFGIDLPAGYVLNVHKLDPAVNGAVVGCVSAGGKFADCFQAYVPLSIQAQLLPFLGQ